MRDDEKPLEERTPENPWLALAGMHDPNDPLIQDWKQEMAAYRESTIRLVARVREMNRAKKSKDDIQKMLAAEFHWTQLHFSRGLDGIIAEAQ